MGGLANVPAGAPPALIAKGPAPVTEAALFLYGRTLSACVLYRFCQLACSSDLYGPRRFVRASLCTLLVRMGPAAAQSVAIMDENLPIVK